jgi:hypothetical protein
LNENRILDTPHFLGNVASLRDLDISGNSFAMPERIGELHFNGCTFIHAANADAPGELPLAQVPPEGAARAE